MKPSGRNLCEILRLMLKNLLLTRHGAHKAERQRADVKRHRDEQEAGRGQAALE